MGWSTSQPSGYTWQSSTITGSPRNEDNNWYWFQTVSKIGRGANNAIAVEVKLQVYGHNYDRRTYYPSVDIVLAAQVKVGSGSYSTSSDYACSGNYVTWNTAQTLYWTGTADKGANVYVRAVWSSSHYSGTAVHTAPDYITTYSVHYDKNGGSGSTMADSTFKYGSYATLKANAYTAPSHKHFVCWNTKANGTGTDRNPGYKYSASADITFFAKWANDTYTISYNANGGTGAPASQTKTYGESITLSATAPTRTNYTFLGWATSATATTAQYQPGGTFTLNANTTLYAVWKKNNIPLFVAIDGEIKQVEKAYTSVNGEIKECVVYTSVNGDIKDLS